MPLRGGGGGDQGNGNLKKKNFSSDTAKVPAAIKLEGGGGFSLNDTAI